MWLQISWKYKIFTEKMDRDIEIYLNTCMNVHKNMVCEYLNYPRNFWIYGYQGIDDIASMFIVDFVWCNCVC